MVRPAALALAISAASAVPLKERQSTGSTKALQQSLLLAPSYIDREAILFPNPPDATNILYNFVEASHKAPTGGEVILSNVDSFPALIGTSVAAAVGFLDPCGLNVPHSHPRGNEFLVVVEGSMVGGLVLEATTGATGNTAGTNPTVTRPVVNATLGAYTGMLYPQGQVHYQFNPTCEPAVFVAAFDNADSGRIQIAEAFFSIQPDELLLTALGDNLETLNASQLDQLRGNIPDSFAELMSTCAQACGISTS
ncbi:RmlC-like cupin domain-containing protein [Xylariales sp. PMI_506]|nr:RmlC-like cupin domain-containing protein [Xylariales sp. PMI_506]